MTRTAGTVRTLTVLAAGALLTGGACASAHGGEAAADRAGCYYFVDRGTGADALGLPWGVRLTDTPLEGWPAIQQRGGVRVATTLHADSETDHPFGYWLTTPADSVEIGHPGGGGIVLELAFQDHDLAGTARPVGDVMVPGDRSPRPVRLTWARCPED